MRREREREREITGHGVGKKISRNCHVFVVPSFHDSGGGSSRQANLLP